MPWCDAAFLSAGRGILILAGYVAAEGPKAGKQWRKERTQSDRERERERVLGVRSMVLGKSLGSDRRGSNAVHVMRST